MGIDVGPIVSSTRPFYKKKLALVLKGENMVNTSNGDDYSDTDPETEPEDDQPAGTTVEETPEPPVTRSKSSSSSKAPKSPSKPDLTSPFNASGLKLPNKWSLEIRTEWRPGIFSTLSRGVRVREIKLPLTAL